MATAEASVFIKGEPVTEQGLKVIIAQEMQNALGVDGGKLSKEREDALRQYEGDKYGNEVEGRSQVVDRTIMETIEWIMPALMRIFASADKIVECEPNAPSAMNPMEIAFNESVARQQTEYLNHVFMKDNPGFLILYSWFKDALLQKLGWVKAYWDTERKTENECFKGLTEEMYQALKADPDLEEVDCVAYPSFGPVQGLINAEQTRMGEQPMPGQELSALAPKPLSPPTQMVPTLYDVTFRRTFNHGRVRNENVAPEEVLLSRRATPRNIPFIAHRRRATRSELLEMGFDYDTVMTLSPYDEQEFNTERVQRFAKNDESPYRSSRTDPAMEEVWISECYLKVDMEGDGIAKLRKVTVSGGDEAYIILANELADEYPLHSITPIIMPHTLVGMSLADLVDDLQLIKTTLWRQTLDNLYLTNNPRHYVNEAAVTENTYDDLLTSRPGGLVRGNGPQEQAVVPFVTPFVAGQSFQMLSYLDEQSEKRSGISKGNQGIAPDDLNKNAAIGSMGVGMLQEAAAQRVELIARIFAEGVRELFRANLGLVIRNQQSPRILKITGEWTPIDPRDWKSQPELSVAVGLGTGNRDKMVQQLSQILTIQKDAILAQKGINGPFVTGENLFNASADLVHAMGYKNAEKYFTNPKNAAPQGPPPPDPQIVAAQVKAQTDMQTQQIKVNADAQASALEMAMRERLGMAELQMKFVIETAKLGLDNQELHMKWMELQHSTGMKNADHAMKTEDREIKKRTTPGATPRRWIIDRDPQTSRMAGVREVFETEPGQMPMGPNSPSPGPG